MPTQEIFGQLRKYIYLQRLTVLFVLAKYFHLSKVIIDANGNRTELTERSAGFTVFGVLPEVTATEPGWLALDEDGYLINDLTINYSIKPSEYNALIADIEIYEREPGSTDPDNDRFVYSLPGDSTQGNGSVTIYKGMPFVPGMEYYAQVVLNYGSDIEIQSEKVKLPRIGIMDDDNVKAEEIKFGDGSKAEKRYHLDLGSNLFAGVCETLTGTIKVIDSSKQRITVPDMSFFSCIPPLGFQGHSPRCSILSSIF